MIPFDIIKTARAVNSALGPQPTISKRTIADYQHLTRRLVKAGQLNVANILCEAGKTRCPSTWFKRRAALKWAARKALTTLLTKQDQLQRELRLTPEDETLREDWLKLINSLDFYSRLASSIPTDCPIPPSERQQRRSKKRDLAGLPPDWRERLLARTSKYSLAVLVTAVTGCRPHELTTGIVLTLNDGILTAIIHGAKVTDHNGQPWRKLSWNLPREGLVGELAEVVLKAGGTLRATIDSPKNFSTAVRDAGRREWPRRQKTITPYCLRHVFSADLKAAGLPRQEVAAGLGQAVDTTCQYYGTAKQSGHNSVCPDRVEAARVVRQRYKKDIPAKARSANGPSRKGPAT